MNTWTYRVNVSSNTLCNSFTVFDGLRENSLVRTLAICKYIPATFLERQNNVRKIVASMLMALDGVVENPQMWTVQFRSEESQQYKFDELFASDALLLGRRTYQDFAAGWPGVTGAYGERINRMPKYVPTTTLQEAEWNAILIKDHVVEEVARLKQEPGQDILIFGSVELIHSLMQEDLIDEYRLMVFPIVVGNGKRLFHGESQQKEFKLVQSHTFGSGVVVLTYEPHRK